MRNAAIMSAGLHVTAITLTVVGLPSLLDSERAEVVPITVELVRFIDVEKPPPEPKAKQGPKPELPHDPPPVPATTEPPPQPIAEPVVEPEPPEPAPKPVAKPAPPEPTPKPTPKPKAKPKTKLKLLARKVVVPQPKRKPPPPLDQFQKLLKNLDQQKKREAHKRKRVKEPPIASVATPPPVPPAPRPPSPMEQRLLTATLSQEVMRQVWPCWSIPIGAKNAQNIRVGVRIYLTPDGHLNGEPQVEDSKRMNSDLAFRAVAESALRALRNPRCSPIKLPLKSFETWREISFNFDPGEMLR